MRFSLLISAITLLICTTPAQAETVLFPPSDCNDINYNAIGWKDNADRTKCMTSQEILQQALPNCIEGQTIVKRNGQFICENVKPSVTISRYSRSFNGTGGSTTGFSIGVHDFCAVEGIDGPGGFDTACRVKPIGIATPKNWEMTAFDLSNAEDHYCKIICFNFQ